MRVEQFDPAAVRAGTKQALYLDVAVLASGDPLRLPVLLAQGAASGPTLALLGGVHGDEYEGPHAIRQVFQALDPAVLRGLFIGVPVTNAPAFAAGRRESPIDGLNLARVFPGRRDGSPTERIAFWVDRSIIGRADLLIDLHSGGTHWALPTLVGYDARDTAAGRASRAAAVAFGTPVIWGHPQLAPGRAVSQAAVRGIPWLYTECASGGWLDREVVAVYVRGVTNVMGYLGMLSSSADVGAPRHRLRGTGTVEEAQRTTTAGFLDWEVRLLDTVERGQLLGRVYGPAGEVREELRAGAGGVAVLLRATPSVAAGDPVFMVAERD
jgi:predicted deacylase